MSTKTPLELFNDNQKLVTYAFKQATVRLPTWFIRQHYDELHQSALMGLWNSVNNYNEKMGYEFSTYAIPVMRGYINKYLETVFRSRRKNKSLETISLETPIYKDLKLSDVLECVPSTDVSWIFTDRRLDDRQKKICKMIFEGCTQKEIAKEVGCAQGSVSKMIKKIGDILKVED